MKIKILLILFIFGFSQFAKSQDTFYLKVHFLYGSKPKKAYKKVEDKWFGGLLGGHVGIETDSNLVLHFGLKSKVHVFQKKKVCGTYKLDDVESFYSTFGGNPDSAKKLEVEIPISAAQKKRLDSIQVGYYLQTPYDYAFMGMRCGAAAYDVLSQLGITKKYGYSKTWRRIFYPRRLRKRIIKLAMENHWKMEKSQGSFRRKWEKDKH